MSAGVADRPLVGGDLSITDWVGSSGGDFQRLLLAQAVAFELQRWALWTMRSRMDGVGEGGLADQVMPAVDRDLTSDQRGATAIAVLDDLEHVVALLGSERFAAPIVEDHQLDPPRARISRG
jgi:hypothetical protein